MARKRLTPAMWRIVSRMRRVNKMLGFVDAGSLRLHGDKDREGYVGDWSIQQPNIGGWTRRGVNPRTARAMLRLGVIEFRHQISARLWYFRLVPGAFED